MKKLFLITLAAVMILSLAACGSSTTSTEATTASAVTTSTTATTEAATAAATTATEAPAASSDVTLVDFSTDTGVNIKVPSDLTKSVVNDQTALVNKATGEAVQFSISAVADNPPLSSRTKEAFQEMLKAKKNVVILSFENGKQIDGKEALVTSFTYTSDKDSSTIADTLVYISDETYLFSINFSYNNDKPGALAQNIQACVDSITITPAQ